MVEQKRSAWKAATVVFLSTFLLLLIFQSNWVVPTSDEGIILEPAQHMAGGARPYLDFFAIMSPGSYWLQEFAFRLLGVSLRAGRVIVIFDFSLQCALLFWLTAWLASSKTAIAVTLTYVGFQIVNPAFLTTQHRWDSGTLALAGLCLAAYGSKRDVPVWLWVGSGSLLAAAAWCTPSMVLVVAAEAAWLVLTAERRRLLVPFAGGVAGVTALAMGALASTGSLPAFFRQMEWVRENYPKVNHMPYGSVLGGYHGLVQDASGLVGWTVAGILLACFALPAVLPPLAAIVWGTALWRDKMPAEDRPQMLLLLFAMGAWVAAILPRADMLHLAFVATLPYALAGAAAARFLPVRAGALLGCASLLLAMIFGANYFVSWRDTAPLSTPAGELRIATRTRGDYQNLFSAVHPGESLFVYPYMPLNYFLTQARNPTRFSFLEPGMMTSQDAAEALAELQERPPQWLLYWQMTHDEYVFVVPHTSSPTWRFDAIEDWLQRNYQPVEAPAVTIEHYQLWRRRPAEVNARR